MSDSKPGAGWENDPGKKFMMNLIRNPLASSAGYHLTGGAPAVDKGKQRESPAQSEAPAIPFIKLQKKGYPEVRRIPIEAVQTWSELRAAIRVVYAVSDEPQIVTFNGDLIRSENDYAQLLTPGLHLVVSYPSTLTDLAFEFSNLFPADHRWDHCPSKEKEATSRGSSTIENLLSEATDDHGSLVASTYDLPPDILQRKTYQLQPPKLTFYPPKEIRFNVTLINGSFPDVVSHPPWNTHTWSRGQQTMELNNFGSQHYSAKGEGGVTVIQNESDISIDVDRDVLPPWSPFSMYSKDLQTAKGDAGAENETKHRIATGRTFPTSGFEDWSRRKGKQVICSIGWEFTALPADPDAAVLIDTVSNWRRRTLDWAVSPESQVAIVGPKSSERRVYANYDETNDERLEERTYQGWWMANETLVPASFAGNEGNRTFLLRGIAQAEYFLVGFLKRCGVPEKELNAFVKHWVQDLSPTQDIPPEDYLIITKFLTPKQMDTLLPIKIDPVPDRLIRIFPIFRVLTQEELLSEKIVARGMYETEANTITKGMGGSNGGRGSAEGGSVWVFELGGARVFGPVGDTTPRKEEIPRIIVRDASTSPGREEVPGLMVGYETMVAWSG